MPLRPPVRLPLRLMALLLTVLVAQVLPGLAASPAAASTVPESAPRSGRHLPVEPGTPARPFQPGAQRWSAGHRGVDLLAGPGAVVRAVAPGVVLFAGAVAGKPVVVVGHGSLRTTYEPVAAAVRRGETVAAGQQIGRLVGGGAHCAPAACLHLGLLRGQEYLDPMSLLRPRVRLLPLPGPLVRGAVGRGPTARAQARGWAWV